MNWVPLGFKCTAILLLMEPRLLDFYRLQNVLLEGLFCLELMNGLGPCDTHSLCVHTKAIDEYPTTEAVSPITSPLVAYLNNFPVEAPMSLAAAITAPIAPYPQAVTLNL